MRRPKRRDLPYLNRGSMADIAFVMMVFFIVAITTNRDWGIDMKLAPWSDDATPYSPSELPDYFRIDINSKDKIMADSKIVGIREIKGLCKVFIEDHVSRDSPTIIHFRTNRHASYKVYIAVLNEVKATFNELWDEESKRLFNKEYKLTSYGQKRIIRKKYPLVMMEDDSDIFLYTY